MIGNVSRSITGAVRAGAAWLDFGVALLGACVERARFGDIAPAIEPRLVAQAITVDGEVAVVHRLEPVRGRFAIGPGGATAAIAAVALASTLGATSLFSFGFGQRVALVAGDPVVRTLGSAHHRATSIVPAGTTQERVRTSTPAGARSLKPESDPSLADPFSSVANAFSVAPPVEVEMVPFAPVPGDASLGSNSEALLQAPDNSAVDAPQGTVGLPAVTTAAVLEDAQSSPSAPASAQQSETTSAPVQAAVAGVPGALPAFTGLSYSESEIRALALEAGWAGEHLDDLVLIAWCESRFMPAARGMWALGLMQVMPFWFEVAGEDLSQWSNPVTNLRVALVAFETDVKQGKDPWAAWQCLPVGQVTAVGE